jgi:hypothetical protein
VSGSDGPVVDHFEFAEAFELAEHDSVEHSLVEFYVFLDPLGFLL